MNTTGQRAEHADGKPTIVLVHGAFAGASSWNGVIERLQRLGYTVIAPANPLRGVAADSAYTASLLSQIDGPVLLAGHSYGGAVISVAGASAPNVVGLVFVAAFAPDEGERLGEVAGESRDSILNTAQVQYSYPTGPGGETAVEYLRGYGTTRFLSGATPRNGQQSVLAVDVIALMDALGIADAILGGFDWGASLRGSSGTRPRPSGTSTMRRSTGAPRPLTTRITSPS